MAGIVLRSLKCARKKAVFDSSARTSRHMPASLSTTAMFSGVIPFSTTALRMSAGEGATGVARGCRVIGARSRVVGSLMGSKNGCSAGRPAMIHAPRDGGRGAGSCVEAQETEQP